MPVHCRAPLTYTDGDSLHSIETDIHDGRRQKRLNWVKHGFELRSLPSKVDDWQDADEVIAKHHPEVTDLMTDELDCDAVLFYPSIVRGLGTSDDELAPIHAAHSDYTERYQAMLRTPGHPYISVLKPSMNVAGVSSADIANAARVVTLQLWRNIGPVSPGRPLAFCDATTVGRDCLQSHLVEEYAGKTTQFESFLLKPPPDDSTYRWSTFPEMTDDEVVMLRSYDSDRAQSGEPFWTPHGAFDDPKAAADAGDRVSVELRAICLFLA